MLYQETVLVPALKNLNEDGGGGDFDIIILRYTQLILCHFSLTILPSSPHGSATVMRRKKYCIPQAATSKVQG